jgi:hypothetical protein
MYEAKEAKEAKEDDIAVNCLFSCDGWRGWRWINKQNDGRVESKEILNHIWKSKNCTVNLKCIGSHRVSLDCIDN